MGKKEWYAAVVAWNRMPIRVIFQNFDGTKRIGSVRDPYGGLNQCPPLGDQSFPLLQFVDPYGNAVFKPSADAAANRRAAALTSTCLRSGVAISTGKSSGISG